MCADFLATDKRQHNKIEGIKIGWKYLKLKEYAHDTHLFHTSQKKFIFMEIIDVFFELVKCIRWNKPNKTEVMRIASIKFRLCDYNIEWTGLVPILKVF